MARDLGPLRRVFSFAVVLVSIVLWCPLSLGVYAPKCRHDWRSAWAAAIAAGAQLMSLAWFRPGKMRPAVNLVRANAAQGRTSGILPTPTGKGDLLR